VAHPEDRPAQRLLAFDLTTQVHGLPEADGAVTISRAAFGGEPIRDPAVLSAMYEALDHADVGPDDLSGGVVGLGVASGLFASNGDARRTIAQGGFSINDERIASPDAAIPAPIDGDWLLLRAGRKRLRIVRVIR